MKTRETLLAAGLAVGLGLIIRGVDMVWQPGAWILGGLGVIALAALLLLET
jgi:hypothetical protein